MNRTTLTGALDYGGNWRLTGDLLELFGADGKPTRIFALRDVRAVIRESARLRLVLAAGDFAEVECGSMADAVNLEDGLNLRLSETGPRSSTSSGGTRPTAAPEQGGWTVGKLLATIIISAVSVFLVMAWIGNQMATQSLTPGITSPTSQGPASSQSAPPVSIELSGSGQQATRTFQLRPGLARFEFRNTGRNNFIVRLMDSNGQPAGLVANEIGTASGSKAIGITRAGSYLIDVSSDGPWSITVTQ